MGAYCPTPVVDDAMMAWIEEHVLVPTIHAMKRNRKPFRGVLYAGLMLTATAPRSWNTTFASVIPNANRC